MSRTPRWAFDECLPPRAMAAVRAAIFAGADWDDRFLYVPDEFKTGAKDADWIPPLASAGGWIVITSDRGSKSRKNQKLPQICRDCSITHVVLSKAVHSLRSSDKARAILSCWPAIAAAASLPPGSRLRLRQSERFPPLSYVVEWIDPNTGRPYPPEATPG